MATVVPLRSRTAWAVLPALGVAVLLGGSVAAFALAVVLGIGAEPMGQWSWLLIAIVLVALCPIPVLARRWWILRAPARLVVGDDALEISYPERLRAPLIVPRTAIRAAAIDDSGWNRFLVHGASGPYWDDEDDGYLWSVGSSALAALTPDWAAPNLLLLFDPPVAGADPRRSTLNGVHRGERLAALLLAADDPARAEAVFDALGLVRPLTMPDTFTLERHLDAPDGGRFELGRRHLVKIAWASIAVGVIAPLVAGFGLLAGVLLLIFGGLRRHGAALALSALTVIGVRLALYLG
jgi:hypothetical protein